jgi:hypothetical protein
MREGLQPGLDLGIKPIFFSKKPQYNRAVGIKDQHILEVNLRGIPLVADLPELVERGAYWDDHHGGGIYWEQLDQTPPGLVASIDHATGLIYFDDLLTPGSGTARAAIMLTGTAATIYPVGKERILAVS